MTFRASVLTLYPEMFPGTLGQALAGKGLDAGAWALDVTQIRDFATDRHRSVDDTPAGSGSGRSAFQRAWCCAPISWPAPSTMCRPPMIRARAC